VIWLLDLSTLKAISFYIIRIIVSYLGKLIGEVEILFVIIRL
jgi:hypothetical protein